MDIQISVPSAEAKVDGTIVAFINVFGLGDTQRTELFRKLGNASFVDPNHVIYDPSTQNIKVLLSAETRLRDIKQLMPNIGIKNAVNVGIGATHYAQLDDSFAQLLKLAKESPQRAPRPRL